MSIYTSYDYLWSEPYIVEGIGTLKCPTLLDIRKMTYQVFCIYINLTILQKQDILSMISINEYDDTRSLYDLLLEASPGMVFQYIRTFILNDELRFNTERKAIEVIDVFDENKKIVGYIDSNNFEVFRKNLATILGIKSDDEKPLKYKSERAKKLAEKIQQNKTKYKKTNTDNDFDNMILKYCSNNKVGINMLNVGNLTYYQFNKLFKEYIYARQSDYGDALATNTFTYKDSKDYNPMQWIKKIE